MSSFSPYFLMSTSFGAKPRKYAKPPVVERVISVDANVEEIKFAEETPTWTALVETDYPIFEPLEEWRLNVEQKEGIPLLDSIEPEYRMTPRFSKRPESENFDWSIRCPRGQLTMNMHSVSEENRNFGHLRAEWLKWLPKWKHCFDIDRFTFLQIVYVNRLSAATLPEFVSDGGKALQIGKVLKVFMSIPGEHECLIPPWDCKATVRLENPKNAELEIHLRDRAIVGALPEIDLILTIRLKLEDSIVDSESLIKVIDACHDRITERFEQLFTDAALQSFQPESK